MVVGIGASAGGLDPARALIAKIPADQGIACILVQHLDPTHESMMVELLAGHTAMTVMLATEGAHVEGGHVYVIPPGTYLSIDKGALHLSQPDEDHGARLPFDHLLRSLASDCGRRAACVIMSGGGTDGSLGLRAIKAEGGFVIVQDPDEAAHDGMPRSAISTGVADIVLPVAAMPAALAGYRRILDLTTAADSVPKPKDVMTGHLGKIIELLRTTTTHDFSLYKPGTLGRRVERRMAVAGISSGDLARYLDLLRQDAGEVDQLAKDLLIHVTSFFRDPAVFDLLSSTIIPALVRESLPGRPLRVWIPGCSTGEETYSLAILFLEQIDLAGGGVKLQIFASDIDGDSISVARAGLYREAIIADISPARLARFFSKEVDGYRVSPELRASVVFTVQDVLTDPPFSRIDLVSCRNLLIYFAPKAQKKVISLFNFALRPGGILLLGSAETVGKPDGRFEVVTDKERIYRNIGRTRSSTVPVAASRDGERTDPAPGPLLGPVKPKAKLVDLCRELLLNTYAPAAVLIDSHNTGLFFFGRTDDYLKVMQGDAGHDVLAMARDGVRTKLRSTIQKARHDGSRHVVWGGRMIRDGAKRSFGIAVQPLNDGGDGMQLICFLDQVDDQRASDPSQPAGGQTHTADIEKELDVARSELESALRSHEALEEEQKAANEEALSVSEEYQSTNEELISSKEELQSLNEELNVLNGQLQETLEQQRTTSNDLQNVLFSTDVATLFLDLDLKIRFFTPTIRRLFRVIPSDVGRPLSDFASLILDRALPDDARNVLRTGSSLEREIVSLEGVWFSRRILPYRTQGSKVEGVVITFTDITDRKRVAGALEQAKQEAERANAAKSRFLAAASHDLRQPLQTLTLLLGLVRKARDMNQARNLVDRSEDALGTMSSMLNTLLDINQIEVGAVTADIVSFPIDRLLKALRDEFTYQADAQRLKLRVVPCHLSIDTDPRLLEQMVRNLLSNALKYTTRGKVLLGCRRHGRHLSLEIWDTGIGISDVDLKSIFEEYHQVENVARDKEKGLGLGLAIVQRLGDLLGHRVHVRSHKGKGSVFAIDVALSSAESGPPLDRGDSRPSPVVVHHLAATILIIEDNPDVRDLLRLYMDGEGYKTTAVASGAEALDLVARGQLLPDLILTDYNLPGGMDGLEVAAKLQESLERKVPIIILTGDITTGAVRAIANERCVQLNKPVEAERLARTIQELLAASPPPLPRSPPTPVSQITPALTAGPVIYVIDDDDSVRAAIRDVLETAGHVVEDFSTSESFLQTYRPGGEACLLIDAYLPGMDGIGLLEHLTNQGRPLPAIMITGNGDVSMAVRAMKAGASDFIEKPAAGGDLLAAVRRALEQGHDTKTRDASRQEAAGHFKGLTPRQLQIMDLVLAGHPSKNIAADLGISQRTVENHRATIMKRTGSKSLPALARLSFTAALAADG
jgi:two-component system CheB/CheR fusion protein